MAKSGTLLNDVELLEDILAKLFRHLKNRQAWQKIINKFDRQIDHSSFYIINCLLNSPNHKLTLNELSAILEVEAPFLSRKTIELQDLGYIKRKRSLQDRRQIFLSATPKAKEIVLKIHAHKREITKKIFKTWNQKDRSNFISLLDQFVNQVIDNKE
jgi:DNA-binding MarR family transcriptional regulator